MRQQMAGLVLAGVCTFAVGCSATIDGKAVAADNSGPRSQTPMAVSALDGLLLGTSQINAALGATKMKVWLNAKVMWDWSTSVTDKNCLAVDGPAKRRSMPRWLDCHPRPAARRQRRRLKEPQSLRHPGRRRLPVRARRLRVLRLLGAKLARLLQAPVSQRQRR